MNGGFRKPLLSFAGIVIIPFLITLAVIPGVWTDVFSEDGFMPHIHCYYSQPRVVWLHVISDASIGLSYVAISAMLGYLVYKARKDIPFSWMFLAFGLFIITCGITHFMEVWTVWNPTYWLSGSLKLITAVASVATAAAFPLLLPKIFQLIETAKASESRRIQLEQANREMERLYQQVRALDQTKTRFFANVSHELRTPLSLILGISQRLEQRITIGPAQSDLGIIRRNAALLLKHVNDLLDVSKLEAGKMTPLYQRIDAGKLLRLVASHFPSIAADRNIQLEVSGPDNLMAEFDPDKIQRVLFNLLANAFKFVQANGKVTCQVAINADKLRFMVQDNGPGISAEFKPHIFERFRQGEESLTRQHGGTGLGLAIASDFVALHQGKIEVQDTPGGGATFIVEIPINAPAGTKVEEHQLDESSVQAQADQASAELKIVKSSKGPQSTRGNGNVLIAEDNPEMRQFISDTLAEEFTVIPVGDGEEAVEKLQNNRVDLIISDIMMPRVSGADLVARVRSQSKLNNVPIIILSAKADDELRLNLLRGGVQDYLVKPFSAEELLARAQNLLKLKQALERVEQNNSHLEEFNYAVSHDLRAPLRSIRTFSQFVLEENGDKLTTEGKDYLYRIVAAGNRMDALIEDMLAYSRISYMDLPRQRVDMDTVWKDLNSELEPQFMELKADVRAELPLGVVWGNRTVLSQTLRNLVGNAIKFVPKGTLPAVRIHSENRGNFHRIWVEDNGIGIEPENQKKIFQAFQRLHAKDKYHGTGIGLALVQRGIERIGGTVGVESAPGSGSRFWIELPAG